MENAHVYFLKFDYLFFSYWILFLQTYISYKIIVSIFVELFTFVCNNYSLVSIVMTFSCEFIAKGKFKLNVQWKSRRIRIRTLFLRIPTISLLWYIIIVYNKLYIKVVAHLITLICRYFIQVYNTTYTYVLYYTRIYKNQ